MSFQQEKFKQIADKIREKTGSTDLIKPNEFSNSINDVYDIGVENGREVCNKNFWKCLQWNGERTDYSRAFYDKWWQPNIFYPKYDMKPTNASQMFSTQNSLLSGNEKYDLSERLKECGVVLDTSECTNTTNMFASCSNIIGIPALDIRKNTSCIQMFSWSGAKIIEKLIVDENTNLTGLFSYYTNGTNVTFEGNIGKSLDAKTLSQLSKESIINFVNSLWQEAIGQTLILSLKAVNKAFETSEGELDGEMSDEWLSLISTKTNWTISLL